MSRSLSLDDPRWRSLAGGYRIAYDPRPALRALEADFRDVAAWEQLWGELHHQGDVGEASYAALPISRDGVPANAACRRSGLIE